ncbi:MAG: DNA methyltransferase [Patescibacteria group bacterium]|nr:MAG: DNA methyltransferase [Patescibacteria group bacterium]
MPEELNDINKDIVNRMTPPKRTMAPFMSFGGKGNMLNVILKNLPSHGVHVYCEPFCRAASLFWALPKRYTIEVLNDIDGLVVNLFRVLQDPGKFEELMHKIVCTPYSYDEYNKARGILQDPNADDFSRAWAFFTASNQGFSGEYDTPGQWSRHFTSSSGDIARGPDSWNKRKKLLIYFHERLQGVQIDCRDAIEVIPYWDTPETFFYCDPPYVLSTRTRGGYEFEMTDEQHAQLVEVLLNVKGMVMLSGYENEVYKKLEDEGWKTIKVNTVAHAAGATRMNNLKGTHSKQEKMKRVEVLWLNPKCWESRDLNLKLF